MFRIYLVRNGRTEEGMGFDVNPHLDDVGRIQAEAVAGMLGDLPRMPVISSPQLRSLETATPLAKKWFSDPVVDPSLTLMPLPPPSAGVDRGAWLSAFMKSSWLEAPEEQALWRQRCLNKMSRLGLDVVIVTHFIVVNMIVGAACRDDRVTVFLPDNGSVTIFEVNDGVLALAERGRQAATRKL